jgi:spore germination protein KA
MDARSKKNNISNEMLTTDLNNNLKKLQEIFSYPLNEDFMIKNVFIDCLKRKGVLLYLNPIADEAKIDKQIIAPLMIRKLDNLSGDTGNILLEKVLSLKESGKSGKVKDVIDNILKGNTILLVEEYNEAILLYTAKAEHRAVEKPSNENTSKGPKESFTEWGKGNRSLIRKTLMDPNLVTEVMITGKDKHNEIYMMYIKGIVSPELLSKVKERINAITEESIERIPILEQWIEDRPYSILPSTFATERPDRVCYFLREGHIALLMDPSPDCMIVPVTFWTFFHTAEDMYQRWQYGNYLRLLRIIAIFISIMLPGLYIAVTNYHIDMIPTDLVTAIAATREKLPFPSLIEILLMEMAFELIREAGVRIPTTIGPTIGIVGALILGQAAVEANIVSPILVIVIALTGLSSFAIPEQNLGFVVRIGRFAFLLVGAIGGFYGLGLLVTASFAYATVFESFGVPFFSPKSPYYPSSKDFFTRLPIFKQKKRPMNMEPQDTTREK